MALPKIVAPKFLTEIPSTKEKVSFRPFLVKEEKALLIAMESKSEATMIEAIKDTIEACVENKIDAGKLPFFDLEYLFLQIRAKSVGEISKFEYRHAKGVNRKGEECNGVTQVQINLEQVNVEFVENHSNKVMITDNLGAVMKYPTANEIKNIMKNMQTNKLELEMIAACVESVFDENEVYTPDNLQEAVQFIESLDTKQFAKIAKFFETMPKLSHSVTYNCVKCGQEDTVKFEGIADFF